MRFKIIILNKNNQGTHIMNLSSLRRAILLLMFAGTLTALGERPNFIFILSDDQSWVGSSALMDPDEPDSKNDYYQTPNMERLFDKGMRFTQGYAPAPICFIIARKVH